MSRPRTLLVPRPARRRPSCCCATSTCSTRARGIDARHDVRVRGGRDRRARPTPGTLERADGGEELIEGARAPALLPAFFDPHVHLRTPGQEHKEDLETRHARRRRRRLRRR